MTKHCIGVVTYTDLEVNLERFDIIKKSLKSLKKLKNKNNYMFLWDNNSSPEVKLFLKSLDFFDDIYFSEINYYDNAPLLLIKMKAEELNAEYVTYIEDDLELFDPEIIEPSIDFMDENDDCGCIRLLKFEKQKEHVYDKLNRNKNTDHGNAIRLFNSISNKKLNWEKISKRIKNYQFYKNNWHWTNFPNISRLKVFKEILFKDDCPPMNGVEGLMMKNYENLNLKVGVADGGAFNHMQQPNGSTRVKAKLNMGHRPKKVDFKALSGYVKNIRSIKK